jgi:beta-phosphoglucomutase family hydrolase
MIEAIIFDMDGTLVDTEPFHTEIELNQFKQNKIEISGEEHQQYLGVTSEVMWRQIASKHSISLTTDELIKQNHEESLKYFAALDSIPVMPELVEVLEKLQANNYKLAVASSSTPEIIDLVLTKTNLKKYFPIIVSGNDVAKSKPAPDIFLFTAHKLGAKPTNCVVIEDSPNGIKAAKAAGMTCVAYNGANVNSEKLQEADDIIQNYTELERIIIKSR